MAKVFLTGISVPAFRLGTSATAGYVLTADGSGNYTPQPVTGLVNPMTNAGDIIVGGSGGTPTRLAQATGVLHGGATPSYSLVSMTSDISGILPVANGGTGSSTQNFVDVSTTQIIAGNKSFTGNLTSGTYALPMMAAVASTPTTATTGGALAAGTYYYKVVGFDITGASSPASNEVSITTTGSASTVTITWTPNGAISYRVYRGSATGAESVYYTVSTSYSATFTDTGAASTSGTIPITNTAATVRLSPTAGYFNAPNNTGSIITAQMTIQPNFSRSSSASIFLDNTVGQVWEFFNNSGGYFGIFDGVNYKQPFQIAANSPNGAINIGVNGNSMSQTLNMSGLKITGILGGSNSGEAVTYDQITGFVNVTTAQTIAGSKTFTNTMTVQGAGFITADMTVGNSAGTVAQRMWVFGGPNGVAGKRGYVYSDYHNVYIGTEDTGGVVLDNAYSEAKAVSVQESGSPYTSFKWWYDGTSGTGTGAWFALPSNNLAVNIRLGDTVGASRFNIVPNGTTTAVAYINSVGNALFNSVTLNSALGIAYGGTGNTTGNAVSATNATQVGGITITGTPTSGQIPTATSGTAATWQTPATGGGSGYSRTFTVISAAITGGTTASTDYTYEWTGSTAYPFTLPSAASVGRNMYTVKNLSTITQSFATTSSQTVDGSTTGNVVVNQAISFISDGSNWFIV